MITPVVNRIRTILAIDDSRDDLTLLQMAFRKNGIEVPLQFASSGEEALAYLDGKGKFADRQTFPLPAVIILDLKMPRVSGFDVLAHLQKIKLDPAPFIVVMSTSILPVDRAKALEMGAFAFHSKPGPFPELCELVGKLNEFFGAYLTQQK